MQDNNYPVNYKVRQAPRTVTYLVAELQKYALLTTNIDIKGKAYEEIVGANLRGDRGEFFTPRNVMKMAVAMINPKENERVLDSSCGTGGFVVTAMTAVIDSLRKRMESLYGEEEGWNSDVRKAFNDKISEIASENYFGIDINPDLVKATKMNMVMNNDGSGNILQLNSLLPPQEWEEDTKKKFAKALGISASDIRNHKSLGHFDIIVTNPPFGSKIPIKDQQILEQFEIAYIWNKDNNGNWFKTDRLQSSVPPEQLFIEQLWMAQIDRVFRYIMTVFHAQANVQLGKQRRRQEQNSVFSHCAVRKRFAEKRKSLRHFR